MKKRLVMLFLMFFAFVVAAFGQSTNVSGTITSSNGQAFISGTYRIEFDANGQNPPFRWNGAAFTPQVYVGALDGTGSFSGVSVPSSTAISPSGTMWRFTVCPASTSPCYSQRLSITGASESVSSLIVPPPIIVNANAYNQPTAYQDSEISNPIVGFSYFNLTIQGFRICTVSVPCTWVTVAGSSGGTPALPIGSIQTNASGGAFGSENVISVDGGAYAKTAAGINLADTAFSGNSVQINITNPGSYCDTVTHVSNLHTLMFGPGTYSINIAGADSTSADVTWSVRGAGTSQTTLLSCPNSGKDVITSQNFATLTSSGSPYGTSPGYQRTFMGANYGTYNVVIADLTADGNRANQSSAIGTVDAIRLYGVGTFVNNVIVQNAKGDCIWSEYNGTLAVGTATLLHVQALNCSMNGVDNEGGVNQAIDYTSTGNGVSGTTPGWGFDNWGNLEYFIGADIFSGSYSAAPYGGALKIEDGGGLNTGKGLQLCGGAYGMYVGGSDSGPIDVDGTFCSNSSATIAGGSVGLYIASAYVRAHGLAENNAVGVVLNGAFGSTIDLTWTANTTAAVNFLGDAGLNTVEGVITYTSGTDFLNFLYSTSDTVIVSASNGSVTTNYNQLPGVTATDLYRNTLYNTTVKFTSTGSQFAGIATTMDNNSGADDNAGNTAAFSAQSNGTNRTAIGFLCGGATVNTNGYETCANFAGFHENGIILHSKDAGATEIIGYRLTSNTGSFIEEDDDTGANQYFKVDHQGTLTATAIAEYSVANGCAFWSSGILTSSACLSSTLPSAQILVGNGSNVATPVAPSGAFTLSNTGVATLNRVIPAGTALVSGDFTLGTGWGSTASISAITGTDNDFNFKITSTGTGQAINPTVLLTFHDGAWPNSPIFICHETGGTGTIADVTFTNGVATTTTLPMIWDSTPVAGLTYIFSCIGMGR